MKYLLLFALLFLVLWIVRKNRERKSTPPPPAARPPEKMVSCTYCGVNLPLSESVHEGNRHYCCVEHLHSDEARRR
jgi:uncharacterized protein